MAYIISDLDYIILGRFPLPLKPLKLFSEPFLLGSISIIITGSHDRALMRDSATTGTQTVLLIKMISGLPHIIAAGSRWR